MRILVATGPQGGPRPESLIKKLGPAAAECELLVHDPDLEMFDLGGIAPGLRLRVNPEVVNSDYVIGIEGIYPNRMSIMHPVRGLRLRFSVLKPSGNLTLFFQTNQATFRSVLPSALLHPATLTS